MPQAELRTCRFPQYMIRMSDLRKGERRWPGLSLRDCAQPPPPNKLLVILHSLAITVEQLCARSVDAPSKEDLRPSHCTTCGQAVRNAEGKLQIVGHGMYSRQVCGLIETGWILIWIRRFLCLACGRTMSVLPDWLHPWRWYAGTVIIEALYRHCVLMESTASIGARFGRPEEAMEWKSLRCWRKQLLVAPTLWGWTGPTLGVTEPAASRTQCSAYLMRLLAEGNCVVRSSILAVEEVSTAVRHTLRDLVHDRIRAWNLKSFLPGGAFARSRARSRRDLPTEKDSGPGPP
jgi:hypothetical protein